MRILFAIVILMLASPAWAEKIPLGDIERYIETLSSVKGQFEQRNADQSKSKGTFYLSRPGRMRFEYDPPYENLIQVWAGAVYIYDSKGDATPQVYPLSRTPLSQLLKKNINLQGSKSVISHVEKNGSTIVSTHDPKSPQVGQIHFVFSPNPMRLTQWIITNEAGENTYFVVKSMQNVKSLPRSLFEAKTN